GGGAGGTVILNVGSYTGNLSIQAQGANGSRAGFQAQCPGPGGGGGGGVIWSNGVLPANVSVTVAGGMAGIINDAAENPSCELTTQLATAGTNGLVLSDFNITYEPVFNCLGVLPSSQILFWSGRKIKQAVSLKWEYVQNGTIVEIFLQRKIKNGSYHNINSYRQPQTGTYNFTDSEPTFPAVYRLALMQIDGSFTYSRVLEFEEMKWNALKVYPNPVSQHLQVQLPEHSGNISFAIYDLTGRVVFAKRNFNNHGKETLTLSLHQITSGIYFISCAVNGEVWSTKFIKQ
ncbi:MAG TPA: T9SS type A sorting domain-containing protein, partial [Lacibacter sp.]|nr:T9SS type A sorting domain-containing protein [Lacibacter sp.]